MTTMIEHTPVLGEKAGMKLKLTINVMPTYNDEDELLNELLRSAAAGEGITVTTGNRAHWDVDLVDVERVALVSVEGEEVG